MSKISDSLSCQELTPQSALHSSLSCSDLQLPSIANKSLKIPGCSFKSKLKSLVTKIKEIASTILKLCVSALLYWVNPSLFAIGFVAGMILNEQTKISIQKIKDVWKNQKFFGSLIGSLACILSLPVTLAASSILWSAHMGSLLSENAQKKAQKLQDAFVKP